jgi:thioredoxin 1
MVDENIDQIREKVLHSMMSNNDSPTGASKKPMELTDQNFVQEIQKADLMVVDFWAAWCGPCQFVSPIIEELASDYAGKVSFGKLNVDENPMVSQQFMIRSIPTIMFFKNGKMVDAQIGAVPKQFLEQKIKKHMAL